MEIFDKLPVLEKKFSSYTQEVFPSTSVDESSFEFEFETDRNIYLDMRGIHLSFMFQLIEGIDAFNKEKAGHKAKSEEDSDEEPQTYLVYVSNLLHSLFSNCEV